jgi:MFS family permease
VSSTVATIHTSLRSDVSSRSAAGRWCSLTVIARRLMPRVAPRWLITAGIVLSAGGLLPLLGLTATSHYLPLILIAEMVEGLGTGLAGPAILGTALRAVSLADAGAASAASSTAGQVGSSIGAALLNTIAATTTTAYLATHQAASAAAATVHGYTLAVAWGAAILLVIAVPVCALINTKTSRRDSRREGSKGAGGC